MTATATRIDSCDQHRARSASAPSGDKVARAAGWRLLAGELYQRRRRLLPVLAWSTVETLPTLLSGWLIAMAIDHGFLAGRPWVGVAWLAAYGGSQVMRAFATRELLPRLADVVEPLRDALATKVVAGALRRAAVGGERPDTSALTRLTEQIQTIRGLVSALLMETRYVAISAVTAVLGLAALAPSLAVLAGVPVLVCLVIFHYVQRRLKVRQHTVIVADEVIAHDTVEILDGMRDTVACAAQERVAETLGAAIESQAHGMRRLATAEANRLLVLAVAESLPVLAVLLAAPWLIDTQHLAVGQVLGAITYVVSGLKPAVTSLLGSLAGVVLQLGVTLDRIAHTSTAPPPPAPGGAAPSRYVLETERLTYAYGPDAAPVICDLTLTVDEGEHLAIVGPSGIGKSTLVDLLTGCMPTPHGAVRFGGVPLEHVDERYLRRMVALIPQESYVFTGTLRDNLRYLAPDATDADLDRAVDAVGARDLVDRLGGYDAELGVGGSAVAADERQMVSLARVYLSPARVVVLDEGTCHLDPAAEDTAERAFRERRGTLIVVAHRMSSARRADRILVMDGTGTQTGTHEHLLKTSPLYRELIGHWTSSAV
jgi:ABC-type multidrug transport system fused ATPase/permease subunit